MRAHRRGVRRFVLGALVLLVAAVGTITAALIAIVGAGELACGGAESALASGPVPTKTALREIPGRYLTIYREAGSAIDISWPFLASIGYQECGHGTGDCFVVSPSGCAGPMEIAYVRGSACSPDPAVPTIWERFKTDGDGDGHTSIFDPADAVFTAAKILRQADGAPPAGGSYPEYHEAACSYYGACSDTSADYAEEVMDRAVEYGFGDAESEAAPSAAEGTGSESRGGRPEGGKTAKSVLASQMGASCEGSYVLSSASGNRIVRVARSQIGEGEHPPGSNCQKYGPCEFWCSLFLSWVWERAGVPLEGGTAPYAYSGSIYEWVEANGGRVLPPTATPSPGDAILYGPDLQAIVHIGIVERVFPDGEITTIAGNFGDAVTRSGPFDPAEAVARGGQPAEVFGYAEPPPESGRSRGRSEPRGTRLHPGGAAT